MQQKKTDKQSFSQTDISFRWRILSLNLVLGAVAVLGLSREAVVDTLDAVALKAAFSIRETLGLGPELSPRLRIFALDDKTTAITRMGDFGFSGWSYILDVLQQRTPHAIIIDKIFALSTGQANTETLVRTLRQSPVPVHVGAYLSDSRIEGREPLSRSPTPHLLPSMPEAERERFRGKEYAYGPLPDLLPHFKAVGHISLESNSRYKAFSLAREGIMTTHLSLLTAASIRWENGRLFIDDRAVHVDRFGRILANLVSPQQLRERTRTLATLLKDNDQRREILEGISSSDVLLLLPQMFTGNTDFKDTALGSLEGGYILAAAINSSLTGLWLSNFELPEWMLLVITLCCFGLLAGLPLKSVRNLYLGTVLLGTGVFLLSFISLRSYWPFLTVLLNVSFIIIPNYFILTRRHELRSRAIIHSLGSSMGQANVEKIIDSPDLVLRQPEEKDMTIMFLDMVGFSVMTDRKSASELFDNLKTQLRMIESIVHRHGGVVDKVLGDGVMCFFGFDLGGKMRTSDDVAARMSHAEQAIRCAMEIQLTSAQLCVAEDKASDIVFPYRIGINTDRCYFGDLGGDERIEFSCIGRGVNYAARLESSAEPFKILIGKGTYQIIKELTDIPGAVPRKIQIKHYSEYFEAYAINPFEQSPALLQKAIDVYRLAHGLEMKEVRYLLGFLPHLRVFLERSAVRILDISESGLAVEASELYGRGALVEIEIQGLPWEADESELRFVAEVKNSSMDSDRMRMGLQIKNLKASDRQKLCAQLRSFIPTLSGSLPRDNSA
jgi:class 3 adenylate cyclase